MKQQQLRRVFFYSCSHHDLDEHYHTQLASLLRPLVDEAHLEEWSVRQIPAGEYVTEFTRKKLESAAYILLLISSDYLASRSCYQEMQDALERQKNGETYVIPILLRPCILPKILEESLCCLPDNRQPVSSWEKSEEALFDVAQDIRLILGRPSVFFPGFPTDRERLLKGVSAWIPGMLKRSFEGGTRLPLLLEEQPDALANPDVHGNPGRSEVEEFEQVRQPLFAGMPIIRVYDDADGKLLILGEPGAGKTTLLLEVLYKLLIRAKNDEKACIPVVFPLASWAKKQAPLDKWIVEELITRYGLRREVCQRWVEKSQVIPLLDGLDEVDEKARGACIQAIADYQKKQSGTPLVICCRLKEYQAFPVPLPLARAVNILPLTKQQVNEYLYYAEGQHELEGLRQVLNTDKDLSELANRPLMLSIFTQAYQGEAIRELSIGSTREQTLSAVFKHYVEGMLQRRGQLQQRQWENFHHWLAYIAKHMYRQQLTLFSVEDLQPDWLQDAQQRWYRWSIILIVGLLGGLLGGLGGWLSVRLGGLSNGLLGRLGGGLVGGLVGGLGGGLLGTLGGGQIGVRVQPAEVISWSWKSFRKDVIDELRIGLRVGLGIGSLSGLVVGFGLVLGQGVGWVAGLIGGLVVGLGIGLLGVLISGLVGGLAIGLLGGLSIKQLEKGEQADLSPNEGTRRSGRNGLRIGLLSGLGSGLFFGLVGLLVGGLAGGLLGGLLGGLIGGLSGGLDAYVQHFVLRVFLWRAHYLPWDLVSFLDEAAKRLLLYKVGGSYIFVHRLLLEYFTTLGEPPSTENIPEEGNV